MNKMINKNINMNKDRMDGASQKVVFCNDNIGGNRKS